MAVVVGGPAQILEVGCGEGELAERLGRETPAEVIAIDQSPRMVELARERRVDARVGLVEELEFADASFDSVVAAWMLFHVAALDRALEEISRVLRPGGRLVAVTNGREHMKELFDLVGRDGIRSHFTAEDADEILPRYFGRVERRDAHGWIVFPDADAAQAFVTSLVALEGARVPSGAGEVCARRLPSIFVAEKA